MDVFEKKRVTRIPSLNIEIEEYGHSKTGARHFHFAADDRNNAFVVAFLTVPEDSTGVAHILEHTSLCGSQRYPIRDPFFMMIRRSLATFMNAFTSSDWTAYPFASQNRKDFDNLLSVYMDAVFFPLLNELDFAQEGHRLEPSDPEDPRSPMVIKGVVYNEMKGVMSQPTNRLYQELQSRLFPTTTYHHNHGGDPFHIPELTHEALRAFHERHYHPSNAVFATWGDIPASRHQERFVDLALSRFSSPLSRLVIGDETRYVEPQSFATTYPLAQGEDPGQKTHVVLGWLMGHSADPIEMMKARLVSDVLLAHGGSPLRRALETTRLGTSPSGLMGLSTSTREASFFCGLEGSEPDRADEVERLVMDTLSDVADNGIALAEIEAVLHQLELTQREIGGGEFPYGLQVMTEALGGIMQGGDPAALLDIDPVLTRLRELIADPGYIRTQVRELLIENPHRVRLTMSPDVDLARREAKAELAMVRSMEAGLDDARRDRLAKQALELVLRQGTPDDPEVLPRVRVTDIPADVAIPEARDVRTGDVPVTWFGAGTNGLVYAQLAMDLPCLEGDLTDHLPVFTACVTEVGSGGRSYLDTQALQTAVSGGVGARARIRGTLDDVGALSSFFSFGTKALFRNAGPAFLLLDETVRSARFDEHERLRDLVSQMLASRERALVGQGHSLAMKAACAGISPQAALSHRLGGLHGIAWLRTLQESFSNAEAVERFAARMDMIRDLVMGACRRLVLVGEESSLMAAIEAARPLEAPTPRSAVKPFLAPHVPSRVRQAWTTSTQVSFCAMAFPTVPPSHTDAAALTLLGPLMRNGFLHTAIRERGGAYGTGAGYDPDSGAFRLFSYRDPRLAATLYDFDRAVAWAAADATDPRLVEEAVLNVIGQMDRPDPPAGEALGTYYMSLHGRTPEVRRSFRASILSVTIDDIRRVASTYLVPDMASVAVLTDASVLASAPSLDLEVQRV